MYRGIGKNNVDVITGFVLLSHSPVLFTCYDLAQAMPHAPGARALCPAFIFGAEPGTSG